MGSKKPARIPMLYRILAIALALLFIGWMMFVYRAGAAPM
jgi:cbb3-type cytochrome oxidase subunit 3